MTERVAKACLAALVAWFALSWLNVLAHNAPMAGDGAYAPWNLVVLLWRLIRLLADWRL